ncbi:unnamed protein product [Durusdinium trenchii]|uniref:Uncharacterized protein n=1 Tax=Durusdinium trenchii TaxID=1381693 RepID=A0ABP0LCL3_9DINO
MLQTDWRLQRQLCVVLPGCFGRRHVGCHSERFSARGSAGNGCCEGSAPGSMALGGDWLASLWPKRYFSRPAEDGVQPDAASCGVDRTGAGPGRCGLHVWLPALGLCAREGGLPEVEGDYPGITSLWIFWMPKQGRWLLANVKPGGTGVQSVVARSLADDGSTWACFWPWEVRVPFYNFQQFLQILQFRCSMFSQVEAEGWESPTADTIGLEDADAIWVPNRDIAVRLASPAIVIGTVDDLGAPPVIICGFYEPRGMANGRVYYVMVPEDISLERSTGPMCLWFAEDRGQWVITAPELLGDSSEVLARIPSRAWWPWEAHLGSNTCAAGLGSAPWATMPPWHGGAALLRGARVNWEVADPSGQFREANGMVVEIDCPDQAQVWARREASHPFVGVYERCGLLASRPYFLQTRASAKEARKKGRMDGDVPRYVLWYGEDNEQWVITEEFRLMDELVVDARCKDSAWMPWQAATTWEVSDGDRGFVSDIYVRVEEMIPAPEM